MPSFSVTFRSAAALAAAALLLLFIALASAGTVSAAEQRKAAGGKDAAKRGTVVTYRLKKVRKKAGKIRSARLRNRKARKTLPLRKVRRAARKGVLRTVVPPRLLAPAPAAGDFTQPAPSTPQAAPVLQLQVGGTTVTVPAEKPKAPAPAPAPAPKPPTTGSGACSFGTFSATNLPGGCWRPYNDSSPFNRKLPAQPRVAGRSDVIVDQVLRQGPIQHLRANVAGRDLDYGDVTIWSQPTDPEYTIECVEDWGTCSIEGHKVRIPAQAAAAGGTDGHMTVVDQQSGWEYDFWTVKGKADGVIRIGWGGRTRIDGDGLNSDGTAARFGNMAGKLRVEELEAGQINHALFFAVGCDNGTYVYPAKKTGLSCSKVGQPTSDAPPMGTHFMLDMTPAQIDALAVPAWKKTILRALAEYGAFMGDTGGSLGLAEESATTHTAFGLEDKWVRFAKANGVPYYAPDDVWIFNIRDGVDWKRHLKVVDPCVAQGTC
jgi:hypothetical protein